MAENKTQFQKGVSLAEFIEKYGSEEKGRDSENRQPFIAAVQTDFAGHPRKTELRTVKRFTKSEANKRENQFIDGVCRVVSDGLSCLQAMTDGKHVQDRKIPEEKRWSVDIPSLKRVNTVLGNLKTMLKGTYKAHRTEVRPTISFRVRISLQ